MNTVPVAFFVYNRPEHTRRTFEALQRNKLAEQTDLFVFSDAPRMDAVSESVNKVRVYIRGIDGFRSVTVVERERNLGCAASIIDGVTEVVRRDGKVIVVEDDIVTSPYFLCFMNEALTYYQDDKKVFSVGGYNFPPRLMPVPSSYKHDVYFIPRSCSWGWGTWSDRWDHVDWAVKDYGELKKDKRRQKAFNLAGDDLYFMLEQQMNGEIDAWDIRWDYHHFKHKAVCVRPVISLTTNIGNDGTGTHCGDNRRDALYCDLSRAKSEVKLIPYEGIDNELMRNFRKVFRRGFLFYSKQFVKAILARWSHR